LTPDEFKILFDTYFNALRNYIWYRAGDKDLATDIAQEAFLKLWEKDFVYDRQKTVGLMYKIASELFLSYLRKEKTKQNYARSVAFEFDTFDDSQPIHFQELKQTYEKALLQLSDDIRTTFLLNRMEELSYKEIAKRLNISEKAVEKRMSKALAYLKTVVRE